ncbi:MAG: PAS domain-containing sensor histidine kinase, partial [Terrimicrobiaceae bacterium]
KENEIELAQAKEAIERNASSLRMILDNMPIPVTTSRTTGDGEMTLINKEFTRLLGYTIEDAPTIARLVELNFPDPEVQAQGMAWWRDLVAHSKDNPTPARGVPFHVRANDGKYRDFSANATVVGDTLILASHDITELLESRKNLEWMLENIPVPALVVDLAVPYESQTFLLLNRKITETFGYSIEDTPSSRVWMESAYPDATYRTMVLDWWRDALKEAGNGDGMVKDAEFHLIAKDGTRRDVVYNGYLAGTFLVLTLRDITEQKKAAAELEAAYRTESILRSEAERIARARSRFLAGVSHEIRTPISALVNLSQSLLMESEKYALPGEFLEHLEKVRAGGQYLNLILTNLLDLSAAGSGHTPVRPQNFYLRDWVEDIGALIEAIARGRSTEIIWSLPEDENEKFSTDAVRLSQILLNLAQNAVKFCVKPNARIWISISKKGSSLELSITDEGPGIPPGKLDELFKEFGQSDTNTNLMDRGVGLGLAVVRQNVSLLGGGISARPVEPSGICFQITVPELHKQPTP